MLHYRPIFVCSVTTVAKYEAILLLKCIFNKAVFSVLQTNYKVVLDLASSSLLHNHIHRNIIKQ